MPEQLRVPSKERSRGRSERVARRQIGHQDETSPWTEQRAVQPIGCTWTTIRRLHSVQYRGGSSDSAWPQGSRPPSDNARPHRAQYVTFTAITASSGVP